MISFILRPEELGIILHIISKPDKGLSREQMMTERSASTLTFFFFFLIRFIFPSAVSFGTSFYLRTFFSQELLGGISRQKRFNTLSCISKEREIFTGG